MPRRPTDRIEDLVASVLALLLLVSVIAAAAIGIHVHAGVRELARVQAAARTPVTATLTQGTPSPRGGETAVTAKVRWTGPDGVERVGDAQARTGLNAGAPVAIWVDRSQHVVPPPAGPTDALIAGIALGATLIAAAIGLVALAWAGTRRLTMARNCSRWQREWARVEPTWSTRYR
ncbi:Rv1733c family protein [Pseudonocardia acaciae]|uniref:Rv1733c family protein n=1 Tax=Pseudonocardia acaciae TaxID=551276 RepID=UPI000AC50A7C|nr:hypothetical protein [Pseudonocardia acaciae]